MKHANELAKADQEESGNKENGRAADFAFVMRHRHFDYSMAGKMRSDDKLLRKKGHVLYLRGEFGEDRPTNQTEPRIHVSVRHVESPAHQLVVALRQEDPIVRVLARRLPAENDIMAVAVKFQSPKIDRRELVVRVHN